MGTGVFLVTPTEEYKARHLHSLQQHRRDRNASGDQTSISGQRGVGVRNPDSGPNKRECKVALAIFFFLSFFCLDLRKHCNVNRGSYLGAEARRETGRREKQLRLTVTR